MSATLSDVLAVLPPDLSGAFHAALDDYLEAARSFWREAGSLGPDLAASRTGGDSARVRDRLVAALGLWEGVAEGWRAVQREAERVLLEVTEEIAEDLSGPLRRLQREFEEQAAGLQVVVELVTLLGAPATGVPLELGEA